MFEGLNSVEHISGSESLQELNMNLSGQKGLSTNQVPQHFPKDIKKKKLKWKTFPMTCQLLAGQNWQAVCFPALHKTTKTFLKRMSE